MLPHNPPVPVNADYNCTTNVLVVTWDRRVITQPTAIGNFWAIAQCVIFPDRFTQPAPGASVGFTTTVTCAFAAGSAGLNRCFYAAAPPDVVAFNGGLPAAPFNNFPLTVHH